MNHQIAPKPFSNNLLEIPTYDPANLLNAIKQKYELKNDAALSSHLAVSAPVISKVRRRHLPVSDALLIRIHDVTEMPIKELRRLMGVLQ